MPSTSTATPRSAMQSSWTEVVRRKAKKAPQEEPRAAANKTAKSVKLTTPKSSAVVITLKPEAKVSYLEAMQKATTSLRLADIGLESVRIRKSATGARLIEVAGADSARIADDLAAKIEHVIGEVATVNRPYKTADLRVTGFDETVTSEDVRTAVVLKGECAMDQIKVGPIRILDNGTGSVLVRCPVAAAKKLLQGGKLLVGWSAAKVAALEPQPMRCYRCMGTGHTRARCPSVVERGDLCYRCSRPGHKATDCTADPFCGVCHHAKRPAGHVMGGHSCAPPPTKGRDDGQKTPQNPAAPPRGTNEEEHMDA